MTVLITGGHGHLGSWTAFYLAKSGYDLILLDTNPDPPDYLSEVSDQITFIQGDVLDMPGLISMFTRYQGDIEGVIHTVGIMGELVQLNPHYNVGLNINGTLNVLEIARQFEIKKIVYTSTGAVYKPYPGIVTEEGDVLPSDLYAATKVSSEYLGIQYAKTFGFEFRLCRVYFLYGPGKLPSNFIRLYQMAFGALEGLPDLRMDEGADQKLDFTYIEDAARGTALLFTADHLEHIVYNIATGRAHSINEVINLARKYSHYPTEGELGPGELMQRAEALDISRAREELGFEVKTSLETGIKKYADWIKKVKG